MKKTLFFLFTAVALTAAVSCKRATDPAKYTGKGAQQDMAAPKSVTIPIDVVKSSDFFTRSIREKIEYLTKNAVKPNHPAIETEEAHKTNYVDWDMSVGRTEEEALNETLIVEHVTISGTTPDALATVKISYAKIKQWLGRDIQVGDEFWLGFRCSNHDGKELARMAHHIKVGNPTKLDKVALKYGFEGWYLEAQLNGAYPTATADFYLGADEKAKKVNEKPVNGHVAGATGAEITWFLCKVEDKDIVVDQPYHVKAHYKDIEFGGDEGITSFLGENVVYAKGAIDAWDFVVEGANNQKYALSSATGRDKIAINTADPVLTWAPMKNAVRLYLDKATGNSVLEREEYTIRVSEKEDLSDASPLAYKVVQVPPAPAAPTSYKADLKGLQFGKVYYAEVTYAYDIKKANSLERKTYKSPKVSFTTDDGLKSVLYTFDSGLKVNGTLNPPDPAASGFPTANPASLSTTGTLDAGNGNSAPGLKLDNANTLSSTLSKAYAESELVFDVQLPGTIPTEINNMPIRYVDKDDAVLVASPDKDILTLTAEGTQISLTIVPTILKSSVPGDGAGNWTIIAGRVVVRAIAGDKPQDSSSSVLETAVTTTGSLTGQTQAQVAAHVYNKVMKGPWLDYRKFTINLTKTKVKGTLGAATAEAEVKDALPMPKFNGYRNFTLTSTLNDFHIDNVQYTVKDPNFKRHAY